MNTQPHAIGSMSLSRCLVLGEPRVLTKFKNPCSILWGVYMWLIARKTFWPYPTSFPPRTNHISRLSTSSLPNLPVCVVNKCLSRFYKQRPSCIIVKYSLGICLLGLGTFGWIFWKKTLLIFVVLTFYKVWVAAASSELRIVYLISAWSWYIVGKVRKKVIIKKKHHQYIYLHCMYVKLNGVTFLIVLLFESVSWNSDICCPWDD